MRRVAFCRLWFDPPLRCIGCLNESAHAPSPPSTVGRPSGRASLGEASLRAPYVLRPPAADDRRKAVRVRGNQRDFMPEGHSVHRIARQFGVNFVGTRPEVTSPQGRFAQGAELLNHREMTDSRAVGKQMFLEFEERDWLRVHLGIYGAWDFAGEVKVDPSIEIHATSRGRGVSRCPSPRRCAASSSRGIRPPPPYGSCFRGTRGRSSPDFSCRGIGAFPCLLGRICRRSANSTLFIRAFSGHRVALGILVFSVLTQ